MHGEVVVEVVVVLGWGGVGWRGEGGNTHSNESITEVNYNPRSIFCYLDVTFLSN